VVTTKPAADTRATELHEKERKASSVPYNAINIQQNG